MLLHSYVHTCNYILVGRTLIITFTDIFGVVALSSYTCLKGINLLLFSQLCLFYYAKMYKDHTVGVHSICQQKESDIDNNPKLVYHARKHPTILY